MKCPSDDTLLQLSERQGIEIDYCPSCRGVWLDRGELDKLIERSTDDVTARPAVATPDRDRDRDRYRDGDRDRDRDRYRDRDRDRDDARGYDNGKKRKKGSFLSEIFEM